MANSQGAKTTPRLAMSLVLDIPFLPVFRLLDGLPTLIFTKCLWQGFSCFRKNFHFAANGCFPFGVTCQRNIAMRPSRIQKSRLADLGTRYSGFGVRTLRGSHHRRNREAGQGEHGQLTLNRNGQTAQSINFSYPEQRRLMPSGPGCAGDTLWLVIDYTFVGSVNRHFAW